MLGSAIGVPVSSPVSRPPRAPAPTATRIAAAAAAAIHGERDPLAGPGGEWIDGLLAVPAVPAVPVVLGDLGGLDVLGPDRVHGPVDQQVGVRGRALEEGLRLEAGQQFGGLLQQRQFAQADLAAGQMLADRAGLILGEPAHHERALSSASSFSCGFGPGSARGPGKPSGGT
jgi:hypothetical protein